MRIGGVETNAAFCVICRTGGSLIAVPADRVIEVMRPLPIEPLSRMPQFLLGLCIIRGSPVPVVDAGLLLSGSVSRTGRLATIAVGGRTIGLAVEQVLGIQPIDPEEFSTLPPLLRHTAGDAVEALRSLDGELLLLLDTARIVPQSLFDELASAGSVG
jgi:purine-binding chemotaxis protein CheW